MGRIRVLVVEDSLMFRELLVKNLNEHPEIEVVATAKDAFEARDAIIEYKPDVMTLDIEMPKMSGLDFLKKLMPQYPMPVVMISALSDKVFDAMQAGAVDFVEKPTTSSREEIQEFIQVHLPEKIMIASKAKLPHLKNPLSKRIITDEDREKILPKKKLSSKDDLIIAIGASTGGTEATTHLLQGFDKDVPGIVIVQHMPKGFTEMYANRLNQICRIDVKEAKAGDIVMPGTAYIAPGGDSHMELVKVNGTYQISIKKAPKVNGHCPSVEVLFRSVAKAAKDNAIGIILTGMGGDGAEGLLEMRKAGARTIGQDEKSCVVYGMPKVAYEIGAVEYQETIMDISKKTYQLLHKM